MKMPLSLVVVTSLRLGISAHVVVTVTPGIGWPSVSTTLPMSLPSLAAEASPATARITTKSHAILRCSVIIVLTFLRAATPGIRKRGLSLAPVYLSPARARLRNRVDAQRLCALDW